jgi:hypothetical protein
VLFLDNVNNAVLSSSTLEHEMTKRPFKVRLFCSLKNALLDAPVCGRHRQWVDVEPEPGAAVRDVCAP